MALKLWCKNRMNNPDCQTCNMLGDTTCDEVITCEKDESHELKVIGETVGGMIAPKMTKAQIVADRKRRSTNHFKKEIYSNFTANSDERKHFSKKLGLKP